MPARMSAGRTALRDPVAETSWLFSRPLPRLRLLSMTSCHRPNG
jgi:hypothetical protein